ncbi:hypothetical protein GC207_14740 [bacterium]|nr:hypothetical protein [bacterium]
MKANIEQVRQLAPSNVSFPKPQVIPRGDGSFTVNPGRPQIGRNTLTVPEVVRRFGASASTWYRLYECGLVEGERPSPRKIVLYVESIEEHLNGTRTDPEYWSEERRARYRAAI